MHRYIYHIFKHFLVPSNRITVGFAFCGKNHKTKMKSAINIALNIFTITPYLHKVI